MKPIIIILLIVNIVFSTIILSKLHGITDVYQTVESFEQSIEVANNKLNILITRIEKATETTGSLAYTQDQFINLTRNEYNAIAKLIGLQEME